MESGTRKLLGTKKTGTPRVCIFLTAWSHFCLLDQCSSVHAGGGHPNFCSVDELLSVVSDFSGRLFDGTHCIRPLPLIQLPGTLGAGPYGTNMAARAFPRGCRRGSAQTAYTQNSSNKDDYLYIF